MFAGGKRQEAIAQIWDIRLRVDPKMLESITVTGTNR
jgi:hypothetical protein